MTAGTWADQNYGIRNRKLDSNDMPHRITISGVYQLPVGRGRKLLPNANRMVDTAIGGWEFSSMFVWQSGVPQSVPGYYLHNAKVKRHVDKWGNIRVFAPYAEHYVLDSKTNTFFVQPYAGNGTTYNYDGPNMGVINFMDVPSYAPAAMIEDTHIRTAGMRQFDTSLAKNFALVEGLKLQVRVDAFNALNHPEWLMGADTGSSSATLGAINKGPTGPSNNPRGAQFSAKITW